MKSINHALLQGTFLRNGSYRIDEVIGAGGMGITYKGIHKATTVFEEDKQVVIKELFIAPNASYMHCMRNPQNNLTVTPTEGFKNQFPNFMKRFKTEAMTLHQFRDEDNMVQVLDYFEENGTAYFTMLYVEALDLYEIVKQQGSLNVKEAIAYISAIGNLLEKIHAQNVLHRDIKPSNILIDKHKKPYLIDFGIAKSYEEFNYITKMTGMGTPGYAAPEQIAGKENLISATVDVYALAGTLYYCLTGENPQLLEDITLEGRKGINHYKADLPKVLDKAIEKAMELHPTKRTTTVKDFIQDIQESVGSNGIKPSQNKEATVIMPQDNFQTFTETVKGVSFNMVAVEGGSFMMGSNKGNADERPIHKVKLSNYHIGETTVTQALWEAIMGNNSSEFKGKNNPVENVSWDDAQKFIKKLNSLTGRMYRLPTEAEWEFAARGGVKSKGYKYSGSNSIDEVAWHLGNSGDKTHSVKQKKSNELGLYDMSGNVWEWCSDWYDEDYYKVSPTDNPQGSNSGTERLLRGGCWGNEDECCRSAYRCSSSPVISFSNGGFRLTLSTVQ